MCQRKWILTITALIGATMAHGDIIHEVEKGDSIYKISRQYEISPAALMKLNGLEGPTIRIGQKLKLPKPEHYTVKAGDTLSKIARDKGTTVTTLLSLNPKITPERLLVDQRIFLPRKATPKTFEKKKNLQATSSPKKAIKRNKEVFSPKITKEERQFVTPKKEKEFTQTPIVGSKVMVTDAELSYKSLAKRSGTSVKSLNTLNGWRLEADTIIARGSEIYLKQKK